MWAGWVVADRHLSPLRYPGGKARMAPFLTDMLTYQLSLMDLEIWMEPFAGGAGAGLALVEAGQVEELWLVEKNPALAAFWRTVVNDGDRLAARVAGTIPTLTVWQHARELVSTPDTVRYTEDDFEVGFAAFIVNRCSRSGMVNGTAGPIGGKAQTGRWTVGSRFNPGELAARIRRLHRLAAGGRLKVAEGDGIERIEELNDSGFGDELVLFVDPPYLREGNRLYANGMTVQDHRRLAAALNGCRTHWLLTYDNEPVVTERLYPNRRVVAYEIPNTSNRQRIAVEYAVLSDNLYVTDDLALLPTGESWWVRPDDLGPDRAQSLLPASA